MNFAIKYTSWQAYALKDTLTVTNICHEVILRSREVKDCPEHPLVTNLFVANIWRLYFYGQYFSWSSNQLRSKRHKGVSDNCTGPFGSVLGTKRTFKIIFFKCWIYCPFNRKILMKVGLVPSTDTNGPLRERNDCLGIDGHSTQFGRSLFKSMIVNDSWTVRAYRQIPTTMYTYGIPIS